MYSNFCEILEKAKLRYGGKNQNSTINEGIHLKKDMRECSRFLLLHNNRLAVWAWHYRVFCSGLYKAEFSRCVPSSTFLQVSVLPNFCHYIKSPFLPAFNDIYFKPSPQHCEALWTCSNISSFLEAFNNTLLEFSRLPQAPQCPSNSGNYPLPKLITQVLGFVIAAYSTSSTIICIGYLLLHNKPPQNLVT